MAVAEDGRVVSAAERVGVGVCGARGDDDALQLGPGHRAQPCELYGMRQSVGLQSDCSCGFVRVERMASARHARERGGVGGGLLARKLRASAAGRVGVDERRRLRLPCVAGRFLGQRSVEPAFGESQPRGVCRRALLAHPRFSCSENARLVLASLRLYLSSAGGRSPGEPPGDRRGGVAGWNGLVKDLGHPDARAIDEIGDDGGRLFPAARDRRRNPGTPRSD